MQGVPAVPPLDSRLPRSSVRPLSPLPSHPPPEQQPLLQPPVPESKPVPPRMPARLRWLAALPQPPSRQTLPQAVHLWVLSPNPLPPPSAALPQSDPPGDARQSPASAAEPPRSLVPGAAGEQSFLAQASPPPSACLLLVRSLPHRPEPRWPRASLPPAPPVAPLRAWQLLLPGAQPLSALDAVPAASSPESPSRHRRRCAPWTSRSSASLRPHAAPPPRSRSTRAPSVCARAHVRLHPSRSSSNASSSR